MKKTSQFLNQLILSVLLLPAFLTADVTSETEASFEPNNPRNFFENVFASYRNDKDQTVPGGGNVLFNVQNANKGDGVRYNEDGIFTILKPGFYLINYGIASIGNAGTVGAAFGFNLIRVRNGLPDIVDSVLANDSSAIVLFLREQDKVAVVSQKFKTILVAGHLPPKTTSLTDTAHISFLRVER